MAAMCTDMHADGFVDIVNIFLVTLSECLLQKRRRRHEVQNASFSSERFKTSEKRGFSSITVEVSWRDKFVQIWDKYRLA